MSRYLLRRVAHLVPTLLLISVMAFAIVHLLPGDPALAYLGESQPRDQVAYEAMRRELGLDQPLPAQYLSWLGRVLRGDLGRSVRTQVPVVRELAQRLPVTIELTVLAMAVAVAIAIPAGVVGAVRPNSWWDSGGTLFSMVGLAVPEFWLGILLIYLFALYLKWLPPSGFTPLGVSVRQNLAMMATPALALGAAQAATIMRQTRSSLLEVLQREYVISARARGLAEWAVVRRHALKNAMIPIITVIALQTGRIFGVSVIVETIFAMPGLGRMAADSVIFRDYSALQAAILTFAVAVMLVNLLTDLVYAYVDPRIRYR